jgi:hypothetical protein
MVCSGDKKFGQKNPCKLEELRRSVTVIKKFGQKNPWKLKELRRLQIPKQQRIPRPNTYMHFCK